MLHYDIFCLFFFPRGKCNSNFFFSKLFPSLLSPLCVDREIQNTTVLLPILNSLPLNNKSAREVLLYFFNLVLALNGLTPLGYAFRNHKVTV